MILLATNYIPVVVNHLLMAFYTAKVPFHCKVRFKSFFYEVLNLMNHVNVENFMNLRLFTGTCHLNS